MSAEPPKGAEEPRRPGWVLLLQRGEEASLSEAAAMTAAAVSLGIDVTLVWFGAALETLVSGRLAELEEERSGAWDLLRESREAGRLRFLACSASAVAAPGGVPAARGHVDEIVGWPTAISLIRSAERSFVW